MSCREAEYSRKRCNLLSTDGCDTREAIGSEILTLLIILDILIIKSLINSSAKPTEVAIKYLKELIKRYL